MSRMSITFWTHPKIKKQFNYKIKTALYGAVFYFRLHTLCPLKLFVREFVIYKAINILLYESLEKFILRL